MLPVTRDFPTTLFVNSEVATLRRVLIGRADTFLQCPAPIINERQKQHYTHLRMPQTELIEEEFCRLYDSLVAQGVEVYQPNPLAAVPDQLMTRDIAFVINDKLVISRMSHPSRQSEHIGLEGVIDEYTDDALFVPDEIVIEGGDIVVDDGCIFVGQGQRSTPQAIPWLQRRFPDFQVIPLPLAKPEDGTDVLHLDCTFLPVGKNHALIYPGGFSAGYDELARRYKLIVVSAAEQQELATNVLSVAPDKVLARRSSIRVNAELVNLGIEVVEIDFNETLKTGGSIRCATMPLLRDC